MLLLQMTSREIAYHYSPYLACVTLKLNLIVSWVLHIPDDAPGYKNFGSTEANAQEHVTYLEESQAECP